MKASVQQTWRRARRLEYKRWHRGFEARAIDGDEKEETAHHAGRCSELRAAGVLKGFAGLQQRLFAHNTEAVNGLNLPRRILNIPMPGDQLNRNIALIGHRDRVGEGIQALFRFGLGLYEVGRR